MKPRLPHLPFAAYEPPESQLTPQAASLANLDRAHEQEVWTQTFPMPSAGGVGSNNPPVLTVYKTLGAWRACDVYVQIQPTGSNNEGVLSVYVYALARGARTLVSSGRMWMPASSDALPHRWICAARSVSQQYEIAIEWSQLAVTAPFAGKVDVAVVASNEAVTPPPGIGVEAASRVFLNNDLLGLAYVGPVSGVQVPTGAPIEVVSFRAVNATAGALYAQLFDSATTPGAGAVALMAWGLGVAAGDGSAEIQLPPFRPNTIPWIVLSSTPKVFTAVAAASGHVSAMVR